MCTWPQAITTLKRPTLPGFGPADVPTRFRRGRHELFQSVDRHLPVPTDAQAHRGPVRVASTTPATYPTRDGQRRARLAGAHHRQIEFTCRERAHRGSVSR